MEYSDEEKYKKLNILLRDGINRNLYSYGWNLKKLSEVSGIAYETLKKLANAKIENPSIINTLKICRAFKCSIESLLTLESKRTFNISGLDPHSQSFADIIICNEENCKNHHSDVKNEFPITLLAPVGNMYDGMFFNSFEIDVFDAQKYFKKYGDSLLCALKITSDALMPQFYKGDIALICTAEKPTLNKICILIDERKIFFRRYTADKKYVSVNMKHYEEKAFENAVLLGYIAESTAENNEEYRF